jgi:hypothetical protein
MGIHATREEFFNALKTMGEKGRIGLMAQASHLASGRSGYESGEGPFNESVIHEILNPLLSRKEPSVHRREPRSPRPVNKQVGSQMNFQAGISSPTQAATLINPRNR